LRRRILIDANARDILQGTGISTYSRTLAAGLEALGHEVSWLSGKRAPRKADALIDEVSLADEAPAGGQLRQNWNTARLMCIGLAASRAVGRRTANTGVVADPATRRTGATFLAPEIYERAHYRHMLLGAFTETHIDGAVDVLHLTAPLPLKMSGVPTVTTIHDLAPIRLPRASPDNKAEFIRRMRTSARLADLILTVSQHSRSDIIELLDVDPDRVAVTYQPTDLAPLTDHEAASIPRVLARYGLTPHGYALFVGAIEPKKNLRRLIQAFLDTDSDMPLAIVGKRAWMWRDEIGDIDQALSPSARSRLRFLGYVDADDLRRLYSGALFVAFPSLFEGFGLPALEALTFGRPVIAGRGSSLSEICGDAALYADPWDRAEIRDKIEAIMSDAALRARLEQAAPAQAAKYSFGAYVAALGSAYERLREYKAP